MTTPDGPWTKKLTRQFIQKYQDLPCLWRLEDPTYSCNKSRRKAYEEMVEMLRVNKVPEASREMVKNKIQNLRRSYRKECRKIEISKRIGSRAIHQPMLWYYNLLKFTEAPDENLEDDEEEASTQSSPIPGLDIVQSTSDLKINKKRKLDDDVTDFISQLGNVADKEYNKPDEYDSFGIFIANKIRKMSRSQQIYAESLIGKILTKGQLEKLQESTDIIDCLTNIPEHSQPYYPVISEANSLETLHVKHEIESE